MSACAACGSERANLKAELIERLETLKADFEQRIDGEYWPPVGKTTADNDGQELYAEGRANAKDEAVQFIEAAIREVMR